jgi:isocitrate dehydrogenase
LHILQESGAALAIETIEVGEKVYLNGNTTGIAPESWASLRRTKDFLQATHHHSPGRRPYKSLKRPPPARLLGLVRQHPPVRVVLSVRAHASKHGDGSVVVRENEEDLYAGIEYQTSAEDDHRLPAHARAVPGSEKIVR